MRPKRERPVLDKFRICVTLKNIDDIALPKSVEIVDVNKEPNNANSILFDVSDLGCSLRKSPHQSFSVLTCHYC